MAKPKVCVHGIRPKAACVPCRRERNRQARAANPETYRARDRARAPDRRVSGRFYRNVWRYGLESGTFLKMVLDQGGACAICRDPFENLGAIKVDHDHATERVRGLLCSRCNVGLGQFRDGPARLRAAAEYLERSK